MSLEVRKALVDNPKLVLQADSQKHDLLEPSLTNTWLIAFLIDLLKESPRPILLTAINTDHSRGTLHNPSGRAVDCWHADWSQVGDDKIVEVMQAANRVSVKRQPWLVEVGLSGTAAYYISYVAWNVKNNNIFVEDYAKHNEHLHLGIGVPT